MNLRDLMRSVGAHAPFAALSAAADAFPDVPVTGIVYDSRQAAPGCLFVALRGLHADGTAFARDAVSRGAVAVIAEAGAVAGVTVPWLQVSDARLALAAVSHEFYGRPSERLTLIGITGTNGKTTTSYVLASIFEAAGIRCGRIGTVGYRIGHREYEAARTTPEAP